MAARLRPTSDEPHTRLKQVSLYTPIRVAMLDTIKASPGLSLSELSRRLDRDTTTIGQHLRHLEKAGLVFREQAGCRMAIYASGALPARERLLARLGDAAEALRVIRAGGTSTPPELARALGISRHRARALLKRLARFGFVRARDLPVVKVETRYSVAESGSDND